MTIQDDGVLDRLAALEEEAAAMKRWADRLEEKYDELRCRLDRQGPGPQRPRGSRFVGEVKQDV